MSFLFPIQEEGIKHHIYDQGGRIKVCKDIHCRLG